MPWKMCMQRPPVTWRTLHNSVEVVAVSLSKSWKRIRGPVQIKGAQWWHVYVMMQLKQENEDLRIELQVVQERESKHRSISSHQCSNPTTNDEMTHEKNFDAVLRSYILCRYFCL
jgi:hypothetical protein